MAMIQIENELSCGKGPAYTDWSIQTAVALKTGIPWSFCNNSGSCNLPDTPGVVFTANAGVGPDDWFDNGMHACPPRDRDLRKLSEAQETFSTKYKLYTWNLSPARDNAPRGPIARAGTRTTPRSRRSGRRWRRVSTSGTQSAGRRSSPTSSAGTSRAGTPVAAGARAST